MKDMYHEARRKFDKRRNRDSHRPTFLMIVIVSMTDHSTNFESDHDPLAVYETTLTKRASNNARGQFVLSC